MGDMSIPPKFASLYDGQELFVWSDCLLDLGTDFFVSPTVVESQSPMLLLNRTALVALS